MAKRSTAVRSLEGWAWADGDIHYHSEVTAISSDNGQLLSLLLEQEGTGTNKLPQGEIAVRQITRVELHGT